MNLCIMAARVFKPEYPHSLIDTIFRAFSGLPIRITRKRRDVLVTLVEPRRDPSVPYP